MSRTQQIPSRRRLLSSAGFSDTGAAAYWPFSGFEVQRTGRGGGVGDWGGGEGDPDLASLGIQNNLRRGGGGLSSPSRFRIQVFCGLAEIGLGARGTVPEQTSGVGGRAAADERHPHQFRFTLPRARPQAAVLGL